MTVIRGYTTETCSSGTYPNQKVRGGLSREKKTRNTVYFSSNVAYIQI